jgi:hypothetical protein
MDALSDPAKHFDTSGKSPAHPHCPRNAPLIDAKPEPYLWRRSTMLHKSP